MKIVLSGCGKIGRTVLENLLVEGHDITVVDNDTEVVRELNNIYDIMAVCGSATDHAMLSDAGVDKAELYIALTDSDELNMLSCFIARNMGAKHTIARIRNPEYNDSELGFLCQQLNLSMSVNPDLLAAQELYQILIRFFVR